ncbi:MAG: PfaD family polyunsaturated fatty acid/polyketide biosynthesis protein [Oligoflexus sp.]
MKVRSHADYQALLCQLNQAVSGEDANDPPRRYHLPATCISSLSQSDFTGSLGLKYPYMAGAMANGISSENMVEALAEAGMLGVFGAAGLSILRIRQAIERLQRSLGDKPFAVNLIHSPQEPIWEEELVDLLLQKNVRLVEASAFLDISEALVRYRLHGIRRLADDSIHTPNQLIAKVSRVELAEKFMSPPPAALLKRLVEKKQLTPEQAELAAQVPLARFVTGEADSGGHTDNRPAIVLFPLLMAVRQRVQDFHHYAESLQVGLAGGIGTPQAVAAALMMGAAYVVTGTINQACVESGTSDMVRDMLASAQQADVTMAPAADMFEMGIKVQVLKRATLFPMRAQKLYEIYRAHGSLDELSQEQRSNLEKQYFRQPLAAVWEETKRFFAERDPRLIARAETQAKLKMALVFRSYLGRSSNWANAGEASRRVDFQVWCGPVMGAFNDWCRASFLESPENRQVVNVGLNLLTGAAILMRAQFLRLQGLLVPETVLDDLLRPKTNAELHQLISGGMT